MGGRRNEIASSKEPAISLVLVRIDLPGFCFLLGDFGGTPRLPKLPNRRRRSLEFFSLVGFDHPLDRSPRREQFRCRLVARERVEEFVDRCALTTRALQRSNDMRNALFDWHWVVTV